MSERTAGLGAWGLGDRQRRPAGGGPPPPPPPRTRPPPPAPAPPTPETRRLYDHPLVQLTLVRFREFLREPEAVFWVFIFPILLAAGLGLAFRNRPADVLKIAAVAPELVQSLAREKMLDVQKMSPADAEQALRNGKVVL